jgi:hypothetical protein
VAFDLLLTNGAVATMDGDAPFSRVVGDWRINSGGM